MVATGAPRARAGRRRRRHVEHHRLHGPRDLRAVRRRRRRRRAVAGARGRSRAFSTSRTRSTAAAARRCCMPAGGSLRPASHETVEQRLHYVKQDGADRVQVRRAEDRGDRAPACSTRNGLKPADVEPVRVAPGQPPHHPGGGRAARLRRPTRSIINIETLRQHHRRAPFRSRSSDAVERGPAEEGRPRPAGVGRRRLHRRVGAAALEPLDSRQGSAVSGQEEHPVTRQRDCVPGSA